MTIRVKIHLILAGLLLALFFQNCAKSSNDHVTIDSLSVPRACGKKGYEKLHFVYLEPKCASCHGDNGFVAPFFATSNLLNSYYEAKSVTKEKWHIGTTQNGFCGDACNIETTSAIYQQLMDWVAHPDRDDCN